MRRPLAALALLALAAGCSHARSANVVVGPSPPSVPAPVFADPADEPQIVRVWLSESSIHDDDLVRTRVEVSTNVASVEMRVESLGRRLHRVRFGLYDGALRAPRLPAVLHRRFELQIIARSGLGKVARAYVPIELR